MNYLLYDESGLVPRFKDLHSGKSIRGVSTAKLKYPDLKNGDVIAVPYLIGGSHGYTTVPLFTNFINRVARCVKLKDA